MDELFTDLEKLAKVERRVAMATLVGTRGTSPKREGAKMWVGEEGRILGSVTIGGCVDARVIAEAETALATSQSRLLQVDLDNEDAWEMGLSCAGSLDVLIEPFDLQDNDLVQTYHAVRAAIEQGKTVAIVTPLNSGTQRLLVVENQNTDLDDEVRRVAFDLMRKRKSATVSVGDPPVQLFFEVHGPPPTLIIFGAGHLSMPLVSLARDLGLKTIVVD